MLEKSEYTEEQIKKIYEDPEEDGADSEIFENRNVEGWSFVAGANSAGNI